MQEQSVDRTRKARGGTVLLTSAIAAALGSFLFGFDTAVISGTTETLQRLYSLSPGLLGFTVSSALIGTLFGALLVGRPSDRWGRRPVLTVLSVVFLVSAIGCALAWNWYALLLFRWLGGVAIGGRARLALIAGPCVIESRKGCLEIAGRLARWAAAEGVPLVFKASYDKANRSSLRSYRGPGLNAGLEILREVKERYGLPLLTDVHGVAEVEAAAAVVDVLQLPAFLCRQTDLVLALGRSGKPVNVKKGQFLAPWDMRSIIEKLESTGNRQIILTERGVSFGYNNLVADMRSLLVMREYGYPVVFDATHSVQKPGAGGDHSGGDGCWAPALARAAVAAGCDGVFIETHLVPARALSDAANAVSLSILTRLWQTLSGIDELLAKT